MRRLALALLGLSLAACFQPSWRPFRPGDALRADTVVLVGSFSSDPPVQQRGHPKCPPRWVNGRWEPPGKVVFVQETEGNVLAFFTADLSERWRSENLKPITGPYSWTYMPLDGHFFVEVPRASRVYLRGFTYGTDVGGRVFELPAQVELSPRDRVVYVGEIRLHRKGARRTEFRNGLEAARRAARGQGLDALLRTPWNVRLFKTTGSGPSLGDEWGNTCTEARARL
jgi:hypothetical protein